MAFSIDGAEMQGTGVNVEGKLFLNDALEDASYADVQVVRDF